MVDIALLVDDFDAVRDCGVVEPHDVADRLVGFVGELAGKPHIDLTSLFDGGGPASARYLLIGDAVFPCDRLYDLVEADDGRDVVLRVDVLPDAVRRDDVGVVLGVEHDAVDETCHQTGAVGTVLGHDLERLIRDAHACHAIARSVALIEAFKDGKLHFPGRSLNILHHSLRETRFEAGVEVEVVRRAVGCKYDLLVTGEHEAVEDVEKRAHRFLLLVAEFLHVVYQQNVDVFHVFEHGVSAQRLNVHLVDIARDEHVGADVFHACTGLVGHDVGLDREQEVRLAVS